MSIVRKWPFARAEIIDHDGVSWIAECRAGTGTWVIREDGSGAQVPPDDLGRETAPRSIRGAMFDFPYEGGLLLSMTQEQREWLGMSDETYHEINVQLRMDRKET